MTRNVEPSLSVSAVERAITRHIRRVCPRAEVREEATALVLEWWEDACIAGEEPRRLDAWLAVCCPRAVARILRRAGSRRRPERDAREVADAPAERIAASSVWAKWRRAFRVLESTLRLALTPRQQAAMDALLAQRTMSEAARAIGASARDLRRLLLAIARKARGILARRSESGIPSRRPRGRNPRSGG